MCFRLVGGPGDTRELIDDMNKKLLTNINASGKLHMVPASVRDYFVIRFCVVHQHATREDIGKMLYRVVKLPADDFKLRMPLKIG